MTTNNVSIPATLRELLVRLKFLSLIKPGYKVNFTSMTFTDASSWVGSVYRTCYSESKEKLIMDINSIIDRTNQALNQYKDTDLYQLIIYSLYDAREGLLNLRETYKDHPYFLSELGICITNIDLQLITNKHILDRFKA
jgi:hypothetical protein